MTIKLFYLDPYQKEFSPHILETGREKGVPYLILDQTAFYPTGGGQPCDFGQINGISVIDVEEIEGRIYHRLAQELPESRGKIKGRPQMANGGGILKQSPEKILEAAVHFLESKLQSQTISSKL